MPCFCVLMIYSPNWVFYVDVRMAWWNHWCVWFVIPERCPLTAWICRSISGYRSVSVSTVRVTLVFIPSTLWVSCGQTDTRSHTEQHHVCTFMLLVEMLHDHYLHFHNDDVYRGLIISSSILFFQSHVFSLKSSNNISLVFFCLFCFLHQIYF